VTRRREWWQDVFDRPTFLELYARADLERARVQTEQIVALLGLAPPARVLDVCSGYGRHSLELARRGFAVTGVDISEMQVRQALRYAASGGLRAGFVVGDARAMPVRGPFDAAINMFLSFGYFTADAESRAMLCEIHRVLRPGGRAVIMLYHRTSANYQVSIRILRRLGAGLLFVPGATRLISRLTGEPPARLAAHADNIRREGLGYLRLDRFLHKATDGPHNVYSSVWSRREAERLFARFHSVSFRVHLLNDRHFPGLSRVLPRSVRARVERRFGWHLWSLATKAPAAPRTRG
jgi:SAM-dependent methyltransferase